MNQIQSMQELMKEHALEILITGYTPEFEEYVLDSVPGTTIHFGTKLAVVCTNVENDVYTFMPQSSSLFTSDSASFATINKAPIDVSS